MKSSYILYAVLSNKEAEKPLQAIECVLVDYNTFYSVCEDQHFTRVCFTSNSYKGTSNTLVVGPNNIYTRKNAEWHRAGCWGNVRGLCKALGGYLDRDAWAELARLNGTELKKVPTVKQWLEQTGQEFNGANIGGAFECLIAQALGENRQTRHGNNTPDWVNPDGSTVEFKTNGGTEVYF